MKIKDVYSTLFALAVAAFFLMPASRTVYENAYHFSPELVSFIKFALLATFGEILGARIRSGSYLPEGFGLLPKAVVWGILGVAISLSFSIFSAGVGAFPVFADISNYSLKIFKAFTTSFFLNFIFAPVMMLSHKVTDQHIADEKGGFSFRRFSTADILKRLDWNLFWGFLMKKTIPFFWIPAHTITFLLPEEFRVLFAALLSIFLGIFLSVNNSSKQKKQMNGVSAA